MKIEYKKKDLFESVKCKIEKYKKIIFKIILQDSNEYDCYNYKNNKANLNNYEKCRIEIGLQMFRNKTLF